MSSLGRETTSLRALSRRARPPCAIEPLSPKHGRRRNRIARETAARAARRAAIAAERSSWDERRHHAQSRIAELTERKAEAERERAELADAPTDFSRTRRALADEHGHAESARKEAADALALAETSLADADRAARQALEAMSVAREQRAASEERVEGARARDEELKHAIASELDCEPAGLAALADHKADKPLPGGVEVERKLENLRQERERLGAVNLRADEELVELLASRDKLISERDDLTEAIKRLRERDRHPQSGRARTACRRFRCRQRPFQGSVLDAV